MDRGVINAGGERFDAFDCLPKPAPGDSCPADTQVVSWYADFHPHAHFWHVQLIESGIALALAAAAAYAAFRVLRRRTP
ncbi:hypothetical protein RB200_11795 [Streptomyces sp. PmtG]